MPKSSTRITSYLLPTDKSKDTASTGVVASWSVKYNGPTQARESILQLPKPQTVVDHRSGSTFVLSFFFWAIAAHGMLAFAFFVAKLTSPERGSCKGYTLRWTLTIAVPTALAC